MAGPSTPRALRAIAARWDALLVVALAAWILAPVPLEIPRSQDHTVHLARAWMIGQNLAGGHVAGWSSTWFFGFPAGELYPVLGDLAVSLLRGLSLWTLPWARCYALVFWLGYVAAALAIARSARALGMGPWPGVIAAALFLLDPGEPREGGYRFTVFFGVWLHPLAVAWTWCALAEVHAWLGDATPSARRLLIPAARLAAAMLTHPITLPLLAILALPWIALRPGAQRVRAAVVLAAVGGLAFAAAAWFVLPMAAHRAWMGNFGALHLELATMIDGLLDGRWTANMSPIAGWTIAAGLVWACWRGGFARIAAVASLLLWLLASREAFWIPRLDAWSPGFGALQYQRFLLCAKPGLWLCAAAVITAAAQAVWARRRALRTRPALVVAAVGCVAWIGALTHGVITNAREHDVGAAQVTRGADAEASARFEADWAAYGAWAREQWADRDGFFRFAYETASRHGHGLADAPVITGAPAFKIGSTPGETFVHRVESSRSAVLDRLRVRYLVTVAGTKGREVARFGTLRVLERPVRSEVARIVGGGDVTIVRDDPDGEGVVLDVAGATPDARLEFAIAGHPRWELRHDGVPVPWVEVPVVGDRPPATQDERRAGALVAGVADRTEPTEPMLIAADAADGRWELRYRRVLPVDLAGFGLLALAVLGVGLVVRRGPSSLAALDRVVVRVRPWWLLAALGAALVIPGARWRSTRAAEAHRASARLRSGDAVDVVDLHACALEIQRVIGPAACVTPGAHGATATFPGIAVDGGPLVGFVAVDDGTALRGRGRATIEIAARTENDDWRPLLREELRFDRGRLPIEVDLESFADAETVDVRIRVLDVEGRHARVGVDLELP